MEILLKADANVHLKYHAHKPGLSLQRRMNCIYHVLSIICTEVPLVYSLQQQSLSMQGQFDCLSVRIVT